MDEEELSLEFLRSQTVAQLRQICKSRNIKGYAWNQKIILICRILDVPTECVSCDALMRPNELSNYFNNNSDGGDNCWIDDEHGPTPCCHSCDNYKPSQCYICETWWMDHSIEWADTVSGDEVLICRECYFCSKCKESIYRITKENWAMDGNDIVCNDCKPEICGMCHQRVDTIYVETTKSGTEILICEPCKECGTCAAAVDDITQHNWDKEGDIVCNPCLLKGILDKWKTIFYSQLPRDKLTLMYFDIHLDYTNALRIATDFAKNLSQT
jgi:hypothetical protein